MMNKKGHCWLITYLVPFVCSLKILFLVHIYPAFNNLILELDTL